eukprot:919764-Pleurochrysis_carterae.AAC.2
MGVVSGTGVYESSTCSMALHDSSAAERTSCLLAILLRAVLTAASASLSSFCAAMTSSSSCTAPSSEGTERSLGISAALKARAAISTIAPLCSASSRICLKGHGRKRWHCWAGTATAQAQAQARVKARRRAAGSTSLQAQSLGAAAAVGPSVAVGATTGAGGDCSGAWRD